MSTEKNPESLARAAAHDLIGARDTLRAGRISAAELMTAAAADAVSAAADHAFVRSFWPQAHGVAKAADLQRAAGVPVPPLAGLAISVKALFDVAGEPSCAGSPALEALPASSDALIVARLRAAGAALVGQTNQTELAFSGVGINPHHGTPVNVAALRLDGSRRIPGGSTSGGASSVACGAAWAALGSDTGGSIRIPAALQGLVGFKNTQRLTPLAGSVPLAPTLDTACAMTRSVRDAVLLHEVLAAREVRHRGRTLPQWQLAVPQTVMLDALEPAVAQAFDRALQALHDAGAQITPIELPPLGELAGINAAGGFAAAEAWAAHRSVVSARGDRMDPRVALRLRRGQAIDAADYITLHHQRADWILRMQALLAPFDAMLSPTVPMLAPLLEPLRQNDDLFFATNARLLRNPSAINFLDGCALSLPCTSTREMPVGLMVWAAALQDDVVLEVAGLIEQALARQGVTVCA